MSYFNTKGRKIPNKGDRVFSIISRNFYRLDQPKIDLDLIFSRSKKQNIVPENYDVKEFKAEIDNLLKTISNSNNYNNMLNGVYMPFLFKRSKVKADLGEELVNTLLPKLKSSFLDCMPNSEFKAVIQSEYELNEKISIDPNSRYQDFILASEKSTVAGIYFPQALQEYDMSSQRAQMSNLPALDGRRVCLSGGMDICAALIGTPDILINTKFYTPIPIMSAYVHQDSRMICLLKAYGQNLEFWCMTQMLTNKTTQVSEQWAGGLTVF